MKYLTSLTTAFLLLTTLLAGCQQEAETGESQIVEASCGQCHFGLEGQGCDLAVRIDGQAYYVDGTGLNDHGDAHVKGGFCDTIRQAEVVGEVIDGRFKLTEFTLLPLNEDE